MQQFNHHAYVLAKLYTRLSVGLTTSLLLISCGVSVNERSKLQASIDTFVSQWNAANLGSIYETFEPGFKKMIPSQDFIAWKRTIDSRWGSLRSVRILKTEHIVPKAKYYSVDTEMNYDKGRTKGHFDFLVDGNSKLALVGLMLETSGTNADPYHFASNSLGH